MAWTERGVWAGPRNPDLDLIVEGLGRGVGRDKDRFRTSAGTRDRKVYERRVMLVKRLADRMLFDALRAVVDRQRSIAELELAYEQGPEALKAFATDAAAHLLPRMTGEYLRTLTGDSTRETAETHLTRFLKHLGPHASTADLTVQKINAFLGSLQKEGRGTGPASGATKNRYRASIQGFCTWLLCEGHTEMTPFAVRGAVTLYAESTKVDKRLPELEDDELDAYLAAVDRLGGPCYRLLQWAHVETGADVGELLEHLTVRHVRFPGEGGGLTRLRFIRTKTEGRGAVERLVPVTEGFACALRAHIADMPRDSLVFGMCDYWKAYEIHVRAMEAAGRPGINRKDLRHVAAIRWRRAGADLEQIREWLGHTKIEQTRIYAAFKPNDDFDAPVLRRLHSPSTRVASPPLELMA